MRNLRYLVAATAILFLHNGCAPTAEPDATAPPALTPPVPQVQPVVDEPDEETLMATRAVKENCLICHSSEIIETQRLTAKQWKAEVEKMVGWGSPLPPEHHENVIKYLSASYADSLARPTSSAWTVAEALASIAPEAEPNEANGVDLGKGEASYVVNCKNCHGANGEGSPLGPNLVERPVLFRPSDYFEVINKGRGRMPMLGTIVNKQAGLEILAWLKTKRFTNPLPAAQP